MKKRDFRKKIERLKRDEKPSKKKPILSDKSKVVNKLKLLLREETRKKTLVKDISELAEFLEGKVCKNSFGKFIIKEEFLENEFSGEDIEKIHILAKEDLFKNYTLSRNVFLDLETSGLSGGVGTFAFLVGIGYIEDHHFKIMQFFLPDLPSERALLTKLSSVLKKFDCITTFNGKSFDLPLLTSRYRLHMLKEPHFDLHLDLLHVARRVYKRSFEDRSLSSLEEKLLGIPRKGDIAGYLIPEVYFHYLRTKEVTSLRKVMKHNVIDVFSMLKLLAHFVELLRETKNLRDAQILYSISQLYTELNDTTTSITLMKRALRYTEDIPLIFEVKRDLSLIYKRLSMWEKAEELWTELISETPLEPFPYVELAKYYEHRQQNFRKAREIVNLLKDTLGDDWEFCTYDNLEKREIRICKKIEKEQ
jgi:uncharacterized protein YprB with RNaseH-like and TPR domain